MSRLSKALILGILISAVGILLSVMPLGHTLEENIGLELLFRMRGVREAPPEVIVIGLNDESADRLKLPHDPDKWPRSLHARLVELLVKGGARIIAFDMFFNELHSDDDDILLAEALREAQNVVLVETIKKDKIVLKDDQGAPEGELHIEKRMLPVSPLLQSSLAVAPFPLPKVPLKVRQYWTFKTASGDIPTLPLIVFQVFTMELYEEFIRLVKKFHPGQPDNLPQNGQELIGRKNIAAGMRILRDIFQSDRTIARKMLEELNNADRASDNSRGKHLIRSLINMYQSPVSRYLNFYGPAHTITTVPYYRALQSQEKVFPDQKQIDFSGKAVFIGSSEIVQPEQRDGYYTVFSQASGVDISGVEIAATAFANLLENMPVQPLDFNARCIIIMLWGLVIGMVWRLFPPIITTAGVLLLSILYTVIILNTFTARGIWYPLFVPLFLQAPLAFLGAMAWKYYETNKDHQNIRRAFSYYLPDNVVNKISDNIGNLKDNSQVVYATCLCTDAEHYSALCETMDPDNLGSFMNKYYETVFGPVKHHDGVVSNVIADSMLALWATLNPDAVFQLCELKPLRI